MPYFLTSTANPSSPNCWVKMETDSVLSGQSEFSHRLVNGHRTTPRPLPPLKGKNWTSSVTLPYFFRVMAFLASFFSSRKFDVYHL